ncbi:MAG: S8 family serine peptidase, partial [Anaerolineae bacterium]|nr:S8 family serine peptidase [Anaerolineae bacterium]
TTLAETTLAEEENRVLIEYAPDRHDVVFEALTDYGAEVHYTFDDLNLVAATVSSGTLAKLAADPNVITIETDYPRYPADQVVPYGVDNVQACDVWDSDRDGIIDENAPTGDGVTICLIDSGLDADHEDFTGVDVLGGYPTGWDNDGYGHGTHVAGIAAAMNNTAGVVGVTPGAVSLYIVKVFNSSGGWAYASTLIDAAYRCRDAGADIINMSLEGPFYSSFESAMFNQLYTNDNILLFAAAGNNGGTAYAYPASYDAVISVGAVDQNNNVAGLSRQNNKVELTAPGMSIFSTWKDNQYGYMSGTSMASPHAAAVAALVWSADPSLTNAELRQTLQETALDGGNPGRDNAYGYGIVQANEALGGSAPTAVTLTTFVATANEDHVEITWETASEINNLGFNLYRLAGEQETWTQLNAALLPSLALGSNFGAEYAFVDTGVEPNVTYRYRLEAVDADGTSSFYGPVSAEVRADPNAVTLLSLEARNFTSPIALILPLTFIATGLVLQRTRRSQ